MWVILLITLLIVWMCFFFFKQKTAYEMRISDWSSDVCSSDLPQGRSASRPCLSGEDGMGRGRENLLLARASRPSAVGALRRVPCLADYTGGRLSFGNERAAPLVFPRDDRAMRGRRGRRGVDLPTAFVRASAQA